MEVKIPVACDLQTINRILDSGVLNALSSRDLEDVEVSKFNYSQLALLISCYRHGTAKEKADAMRFLRRILTSYRANGSREAGLALENLLYSSYLKYCENEQDYHRFYSSVASSYRSQTVRVRLKGKNLGFFVHSPHLLAHVTPILELLKSRLSLEMDEPAVVIFTLGTNPQFEKAFLELGAVVIDLKLESFTSLPRELIRNCQANDVGNLVWQCLPTFLSYAVSKIEGIHWWSLKYHPNIDGVSKYITNSQYNKKITFNGRKWQKFVPPVGLKNIDAAPMTWESRALTFGAFCREELIDHDDYWRFVARVIEIFDLTFCYAGRTQIHARYLDKFSIPAHKVVFLGWLENPAEKILGMNFLLDGGLRGHGIMALEAIAGGVPVICPHEYLSSDHSPMKSIYAEFDENSTVMECKLIKRTRYCDEDSLESIIKEFCCSPASNKSLAELQKLMLERRSPNNFADFCALIEPQDVG